MEHLDLQFIKRFNSHNIFYCNSNINIMEPIEQPIEQPKKDRKENPWLEYVKEIKIKNPNMSYKEVLQLAKESYVKKDKPITPKRVKKPKLEPVDEEE